MTSAQALTALKQGKHAYRTSWHPYGLIFVKIVAPTALSVMSDALYHDQIAGAAPVAYAAPTADTTATDWAFDGDGVSGQW